MSSGGTASASSCAGSTRAFIERNSDSSCGRASTQVSRLQRRCTGCRVKPGNDDGEVTATGLLR
jgi:hypothetical protein